MTPSDPVGHDILEIPGVISKIMADWDRPTESLNRMSAWTFTTLLRKRMAQHDDGSHDGSVDLLISGCEVSLWIGEQFHSDLHRVFPKLKIVTLSANKLLGQLGQSFPIPQTNFPYHGESYNLQDTPCLLLSHSGGTFATLACSNLLKSVTTHIFCVTSEWDTQIAASIRAGTGVPKTGLSFDSYVFTTHIGCRPAEPVTLSCAATHQILTQLLLYIMYYLRHFESNESSGKNAGSQYEVEEVRELAQLNENNLEAIRDIIGQVPTGRDDDDGSGSADGGSADGGDAGSIPLPKVPMNGRIKDTPTSAALRKQGRHWAQHVLEGPISWIVSALYIAITVIWPYGTPLGIGYGFLKRYLRGYDTPVKFGGPAPEVVSAVYQGANVTCTIEPLATPVITAEIPVEGMADGLWVALDIFIQVLDAAIYIFLPIWTTWIIRLCQGRPWLHRVSGRSLLIGDIPWVSQSIEAYVSKLFALSYSIATIGVASGNPTDHLVHRHTHRVVRGALLVVGRPDGRLNGLASAENTVSLSLNQASSIQNLGVTCESVSIGHNPFKLPLSKAHNILPGKRALFLVEKEYELRLKSEKARGWRRRIWYARVPCHACSHASTHTLTQPHPHPLPLTHLPLPPFPSSLYTLTDDERHDSRQLQALDHKGGRRGR